MSIDTAARPVVSISSAVIALLGLWLIVSHWVLGAPGPKIATSGVICGVIILICSGIRFAYRHTSLMSWINALAGAWILGAAWIFNENSPDVRTWSYTIAGAVIACLEVISLTSSALRPQTARTNRLSTRN
jgi:hypothetical protein